MSQEDREKWDRRYAEGAYADREAPADWLASCEPALRAKIGATPADGVPRALDLACGAGRNARYLARLGFSVDAVDISPVGLARAGAVELPGCAPVTWHEHDLDRPLPAAIANQRYHVVTIMRYLNPRVFQEAAALLTPGGLIFIEVHLKSDQPVHGPSSDRFRVAHGALAAIMATTALQTEVALEGLVRDPDGRCMAVARYQGRRLLSPCNDEAS